MNRLVARCAVGVAFAVTWWLPWGVLGHQPPGGGQPGPGRVEPAVSAALVRLHEDQPADRGTQHIGSLVTRRVTLENVAGVPVSLRVLGTSCLCTVGRLGKTVLPPGETTWLSVETQAAMVGSMQWYNVEVEAAPAEMVTEVSRSQRVVVDIGYRPDMLAAVFPHRVNITAVEGEPATFDMLVRRLDRAAIHLGALTAAGDWLGIGTIGASPDGDRSIAIVTLESKLSRTGYRHGTLRFPLAQEDQPGDRADVFLRVVSPFAARPPGVIFQETRDGWQPDRTTFRLVPQGNPTTTHDPVSARLGVPSGAIHVGHVEQAARAEWTLTVRIDTARLWEEGQHGSRAIEVLDDRGAVLCVIPIFWFARDALSPPTSLDAR